MRLFSLLVRFNEGLLSTDQDTCIPMTTAVFLLLNTNSSEISHPDPLKSHTERRLARSFC